MSTVPPALPIAFEPLPYQDRLEARPLAQIDLVVIHCTELPDLAMARRFGEEVLYDTSLTGNSGHYYIDRDGSLHQYVALDRIAHHVRGYNPRAIGVELVNRGRYPDWLVASHQTMEEAYGEVQVEALSRLLDELQATLPSLRFIAGHEDLDTAEVAATDDPDVKVRRKRDPGPMFPWDRVMARTGLSRIP